MSQAKFKVGDKFVHLQTKQVVEIIGITSDNFYKIKHRYSSRYDLEVAEDLLGNGLYYQFVPTNPPIAAMSGPFTPPKKEPKYAIGDIVLIYNKKAKVIAVHEEKYSPTDTYVYFMYDIEWLEDVPVSTTKFNEGSLNAWGGPEIKPKNPCECGAWAVEWASEHHAHWCPMHKVEYKSE